MPQKATGRIKKKQSRFRDGPTIRWRVIVKVDGERKKKIRMGEGTPTEPSIYTEYYFPWDVRTWVEWKHHGVPTCRRTSRTAVLTIVVTHMTGINTHECVRVRVCVFWGERARNSSTFHSLIELNIPFSSRAISTTAYYLSPSFFVSLSFSFSYCLRMRFGNEERFRGLRMLLKQNDLKTMRLSEKGKKSLKEIEIKSWIDL